MLDYLIRYIVTAGNNEHMKSVSVFLQVSTTTDLLFIFSYKNDINDVSSNALSGCILNLLLRCIIF